MNATIRTPVTWRVMKFGGTSVGDPANWPSIKRTLLLTLSEGAAPVVVCSALSGVTDLLAAIIRAREAGRPAADLVEKLSARHQQFCDAMGLPWRAHAQAMLPTVTSLATGDGPLSPSEQAELLAQGELMSTRLAAAWLQAQGIGTCWLDARRLLRASPRSGVRNESDEYLSATCERTADPALQHRLAARSEPVLVTQGFIASNEAGETVVLGRGGSDTSAALLAAKLEAERLEIWTDVPGTFTTNPAQHPSARLLRTLGVEEVEVMAAMGASVLHPLSLAPVRAAQIPTHIRWTRRPDLDERTRIIAGPVADGPKAVTVRRKVAALEMNRPHAWQPIGFMADVSRCFQQAGLSMDLIASSPGSIRATVDLQAFPSASEGLSGLARALSSVCDVTVHRDVSCVSVVGQRVSQHTSPLQPALETLAPSALRFVTHCASDSHVSYVVSDDAAPRFVAAAHAGLFDRAPQGRVFGPTWTTLQGSC